MSTPPFRRIGIAGLGLIGGSIARGARTAWPKVEIVGFDRAEHHREIESLAAVDAIAPSLRDLSSCDLVVLALPVSVIVDRLPETAAFEASTLVTDVGSSKRHVMAAALEARVKSFIGGHPMGGSERTGLANASASLLEGRPWMLVRASAGPDAEARLEGFVAALGARPIWMEAEQHDRAVAYVSQLPQIVAVALMNAADEMIGQEGLQASGRAFGEMTRLASSPAELWEGILESNADFVGEALEEFAARLPTLGDLEGGEWIRQAFERAARARAERETR